MKKKISKQIIKALIKTLHKKKCSLHEPWFDRSEIKYLENAIKQNSVSTYGKETKIFESKIKKYTGSKYVYCMINGTSGIHLSLYLMGINHDSEVLIPALNYIASANATVYLGGIPHFIDVEEKTLGPDPVKLNAYLNNIAKIKNGVCYNKKTNRKIKILVLTHIFGHPSNLKEIIKVCKKFKIKIIEDAAEGLGTFYKKKHVGTFGTMGVLSFNGNKIITTGGGGAILTNSKKIAKRIESVSKNSRIKHAWEYKYNELGFNYRMPSINAQIGIAQIKKIKKFLNLKKKLFKKYKLAFKNIENVKIFEEPDDCKSNYWLQTLILKKPNINLQKYILSETNKKGYGTRPVWNLVSKSNHLKKFPRMRLKTASSLEKRIINLPSSPFLCNKR